MVFGSLHRHFLFVLVTLLLLSLAVGVSAQISDIEPVNVVDPCPEPVDGPWPCSSALGPWVNGEPPNLLYFDAVKRGYCKQRGLLREVWYKLPGDSIDDLLDDPNFPFFPDARERTSAFDMPYNITDDYGVRARGYLVAPIDGVYQFWLSADREAVLLMGRGENVATAREVARVEITTRRYDWTQEQTQRSSLMYFRAGEKVYMEVLHKEDGKSDHLSVAWRMPGQPITREPEIIEPRYLCAYDLRFEPRELSVKSLPEGTVEGSGELLWPAKGRISQYFKEGHRGLDIAIPTGTPVVAADKGEVIFSSWHPCFGNLLIVDHGLGLHTYYAHLSEQLVVVGEKVEQGDVIAMSGNTGCSTGPHLHFEVRQRNTRLNPLSELQRLK